MKASFMTCHVVRTFLCPREGVVVAVAENHEQNITHCKRMVSFFYVAILKFNRIYFKKLNYMFCHFSQQRQMMMDRKLYSLSFMWVLKWFDH